MHAALTLRSHIKQCHLSNLSHAIFILFGFLTHLTVIFFSRNDFGTAPQRPQLQSASSAASSSPSAPLSTHLTVVSAQPPSTASPPTSDLDESEVINIFRYFMLYSMIYCIVMFYFFCFFVSVFVLLLLALIQMSLVCIFVDRIVWKFFLILAFFIGSGDRAKIYR